MLLCTAGDAFRPTRGSQHLSIVSTSLCRLRLIDTAPALTNVELGDSVRLPRGAAGGTSCASFKRPARNHLEGGAMNRLWIGAIAMAVASAVACGTAAAQVAKYVDAQGVTHYAGSEAQIPEQYRSQAAPAGLTTDHGAPNSDVRQDRRGIWPGTPGIRGGRARG